MMKIVYENEWSGYEDWAGFRIYEDDDGRLFAHYANAGPETDSWADDYWTLNDPYPITLEHAVAMAERFDQTVAEIDEEMGR